MKRLALLALLSSMACAATPTQATSPAPAPAVSTAAQPPTAPQAAPNPAPERLAIVDMVVHRRGQDPIRIFADGRVEIAGKGVATLHSDGRLIRDSSAFELLDDGTIAGAEQLMRISISRAGIMNVGGRAQYAFADDGSIRAIEPGTKTTRIEGASEGRRAAAFVMVLAAELGW